MAGSFPRRQSHTLSSRKRFLSDQISPAIRVKTCPICLGNIHSQRAAVITACMHAYCLECIRKWSHVKRTCPLCNAYYDSWFFNIDLSYGTFQKKQLSVLDEVKLKDANFEVRLNQRNRLVPRRVIRRTRHELDNLNSRTRPLPLRRSFGRPGLTPPEVVAGSVLQWRASIYSRDIHAVPSSSRNHASSQSMSGYNIVKERILGRIEPWIRRELQAILKDPDPSVIVYVASSLFISGLDVEHKVPSTFSYDEATHLAPLRPFLNEWSNKFWHELRCFAESSLTMKAYDTVVEYKHD